MFRLSFHSISGKDYSSNPPLTSLHFDHKSSGNILSFFFHASYILCKYKILHAASEKQYCVALSTKLPCRYKNIPKYSSRQKELLSGIVVVDGKANEAHIQ